MLECENFPLILEICYEKLPRDFSSFHRKEDLAEIWIENIVNYYERNVNVTLYKSFSSFPTKYKLNFPMLQFF